MQIYRPLILVLTAIILAISGCAKEKCYHCTSLSASEYTFSNATDTFIVVSVQNTYYGVPDYEGYTISSTKPLELPVDYTYCNTMPDEFKSATCIQVE